MAHASQKITAFPDRKGPYPAIVSIPPRLLSDERDPTREIRNLVEQLEDAAREARRQQRLAEDELERLGRRLAEHDERAATNLANDAQIKALTRERDMLLGQQSQYGPIIAELKQKLKASESERIAAIRERDDAICALRNAVRDTERAEKSAKDAERKRDESIRQCELARKEQEEAHSKTAVARKNFSEAQKALAEAKKELGQARNGDGELAQQLSAVRQARDGMAAQIKDLKRKVSELEDETADLSYSRDAALHEAEAAHAKLAGSQAVLDAASKAEAAAERAAERTAVLEAELQELNGQLEGTLKEREAAARSLEEAHASLIDAQEQLRIIISDRDTVKQQLADGATALDAELQTQAAEVARLHAALQESETRRSRSEELERQFDKRRLDMIELNAQLENAQREIRNLSASLAEARLQAKLAASKAGTRQPTEVSKPATGPRPDTMVHGVEAMDEASPADPAGENRIVAIRRCFQNFIRNPRHLDLLIELKNHGQDLADAGGNHSKPVLHRISTAFVSLIEEMQTVPAQISQETFKTVNQTIELIASLLEVPGSEESLTLDDARVYIVDDDPATCATVVDALNTVGLAAKSVLYSSTAVAELAGNRYDLIILDIHLPDLDGFDLCSHIRDMALHAETPVFFITGNTSLENRVKSSLRGGNEFIAKPFSVPELALKALKAVIASRFQSR